MRENEGGMRTLWEVVACCARLLNTFPVIRKRSMCLNVVIATMAQQDQVNERASAFFGVGAGLVA